MTTTDIAGATRSFERWLGSQLVLVKPDIEYKHERMAADAFSFMRATFYRWAQVWPEVLPADASAPRLNAVGDLHVENYGTWRDVEGRLIWGINDFDEADVMPYTIDLTRLATSVQLAGGAGKLSLPMRDACEAILVGYRDGLEAGGRPFVLAERDRWLRRIVWSEARDPGRYWARVWGLPRLARVQPDLARAVRRTLPPGSTNPSWARRRAGLGSLGRQRVVARAELNSARVAREGKSLAISAWEWARPDQSAGASLYRVTLERAVRAPDPSCSAEGAWVLRRIAPDCSTVRLSELAKKRDESRLLHAMGWEAANIHLGSGNATAAVKRDLKQRPSSWLRRAAMVMSDAVRSDWKEWRRGFAAGQQPG